MRVGWAPHNRCCPTHAGAGAFYDHAVDTPSTSLPLAPSKCSARTLRAFFCLAHRMLACKKSRPIPGSFDPAPCTLHEVAAPSVHHRLPAWVSRRGNGCLLQNKNDPVQTRHPIHLQRPTGHRGLHHHPPHRPVDPPGPERGGVPPRGPDADCVAGLGPGGERGPPLTTARTPVPAAVRGGSHR
mgnify:CR=1 FL=1